MSQVIPSTSQFSFAAKELAQQLIGNLTADRVGYWEFQFDRLADREKTLHWSIAVANGRILYSGNRPWSSQSLMRVIHRYASHTRNDLVRSKFEQIDREAQARSLAPDVVLALLKKIGIVHDNQLAKVIQTKILSDLDLYLLMGSGKAKFRPQADLVVHLPLPGFEPTSLFADAERRLQQWDAIQAQVPSMKLIPRVDRQGIAKLPHGQQERIINMLDAQQPLMAISEAMAKDPLEIAQMFARLIASRAVVLYAPESDAPTPILLIDDSPLIISQFQAWIEGFGYTFVACQESETALAKIVEIQPAAVLIDINMPGLSGFDLVKQIRKQPQLAAIPLTILTGEQGISNRWRAQWSGCNFLNKPLESGELEEYQQRLHELLLKLAGPPAALTQYN